MDIKLKLSHNLCFKFCLWYFVLIFGKEWPLNNESAIVLSLPENTNSYICVYLLSQGLSLSIREYASNPPLELLNSTPYLPPPPLQLCFESGGPAAARRRHQGRGVDVCLCALFTLLAIQKDKK